MAVSSESLCEKEPNVFFERFGKIFGGESDVFLMNPFWTDAQKAVAEALRERFDARKTAATRDGKIFIASGGSGGKIRFVAHTKKTLEASARGLLKMLALPARMPLNCFACLPPWHVSGLMPFVRTRVSGGKLFVAESGSFHEETALPNFRERDGEFWMNSLVPTQLRRLLNRKDGAAWLRQFDFILLGGASVPADLIEQAKAENLNFGIGYGMTETASLVALWTPRNGEKIAGALLPHAKIFLNESDKRIVIRAESLGETLSDEGELLPNPDGCFRTNDEGKFDENRCLLVLGRADRYINSGGEKIDPALVEAALRTAGTPEVLVVGEPDADWGERVVALVKSPAPPMLLSDAKKTLPAWMMPKRVIDVPALPFDAKGKLDREKLRELLS